MTAAAAAAAADIPQCRNCLKRHPTAIRCPNCNQATYCSSKCMLDDRQMHFVLCFTMGDGDGSDAKTRAATTDVDPPPPPPPSVTMKIRRVKCTTRGVKCDQKTAIPIREGVFVCSNDCRSGRVESAAAAAAANTSSSSSATAIPPAETIKCHGCSKRCAVFTTLTDSAAREFCSIECRAKPTRTLPHKCNRCYKPCGTDYVDLRTATFFCSESCRYPASAATFAIARGGGGGGGNSDLADVPGEVVYPFDNATSPEEISTLLQERIRHDVDCAMRIHGHDPSMRQVVAESLYPTSLRLKLLEQANEQMLQRQFPHRIGLVCKLHDRHLAYGKPCPECTGQSFSAAFRMCPTHGVNVAHGKLCARCLDAMNLDQKSKK